MREQPVAGADASLEGLQISRRFLEIDVAFASTALVTSSMRKLLLIVHVASAVSWVGALLVFFAHALASLISQDEQIVRAASLVMGLTAWFVITPLSITSLVTGLAQAFVTAWGLLRHYWVLFKLLLTLVATGVLLLKLQPISTLADAAAMPAFSSSDLAGLRTSLALHAAGGLVVLITAVVLAVYKPAGAIAAGMPRWARVFGIVLAAFAALVVIMALFGSHGPGAHAS